MTLSLPACSGYHGAVIKIAGADTKSAQFCTCFSFGWLRI